MTEFLWFWVIAGIPIVLGVLFATIFFRNYASKEKLNKLQEALFVRKNRHR